tara:strand:- start:115 stop:342 length:228 start_codon:yes stop_codon:yes gene_type:complete
MVCISASVIEKNRQGPERSRVAITHRNIEAVKLLKHPDEAMTDYINALLAESLAKERNAKPRGYTPNLTTKESTK